MKAHPGGRLTVLILSGDMEKGMAACNLALTALASGRKATLFFSFWGVNFLKRSGERGRGTFLARALSTLDRDHAGRQRLGRFNLGGAGRWVMSRLMRRRRIPSVLESLVQAHHMGAHIIACSNSLELMGLDRRDLIPEVDDIAGAMTFLDAASEGIVVTLS